MAIDKDLQLQLGHYDNDDEDAWDIPELDDSVYNPANDEFKRTLASIKNQICQLATSMPPRHAMMVKINMAEGSYKKTAARIKSTPDTVSRVCRSPNGLRLKNLLINHQQLISGVTAIEREMLLWRIALNNEEMNPRTSVSAVAELNKMKADSDADLAKKEENKTIADKPQIIIQFADPRLLPTVLDVN